MQTENEIRHRKHELLELMDRINDSMSRKIKEVETDKQYIKDCQSGIDEINKILGDN